MVKLLNEALATELVCILRYKRHYFMASGINADSVAQEFLQHATEEQGHADLIATHIVQLKGEPNFNLEGLAMHSHAEYVEGDSLADMIREDLVAERIAIESWCRAPGRALLRLAGQRSPRTDAGFTMDFPARHRWCCRGLNGCGPAGHNGIFKLLRWTPC